MLRVISESEILSDPNLKPSISWILYKKHYRHKLTNAHAEQIGTTTNYEIHIDKYNPHNGLEEFVGHALYDWNPIQQLAVGISLVLIAGWLFKK